MTSTAETLSEIEKQEFRAVDVSSRMAQRDPRRPKLQAALDRLRLAKGELLSASPDTLRKLARNNPMPPVRWVGLPSVASDVAKTVHEARDRAAEERRLGRSTGRRYQAPQEFRGKRIDLVDGRKLDVPAHGLCEIADGRHPAARDETVSPAHQHLMQLGFRLLPDSQGAMDGAAKASIVAALRRPMHGDRALTSFLNRSAAGA